MERDIRYMTVGLVVAVLLSVGVGLILWQVSDQSTGRGGQIYVIPFEGSVGGLNVGSAVRYMGMQAGNVTQVGMAQGDFDQIEVRIQMNQQTPINASTVARIRPRGITGRSYIGLTTSQPTTEAGPARRDTSHDVPVLRGKPSQLDRLLSRLPELMDNIEGVTANAQKLLSADKRQAVAATLDSARRTLANARKLLGPSNRESFAATLANTATLTNKANKLTQQASGAVQRLDANLASLEHTINETTHSVRAVRALLPHLKRAADNVAGLTDRLDRLLATYGDDYGELGTRNLRQLRTLLRDARRTSGTIRDLADQLSNNPSQLIFQRAEEGMEIPR